MQSADWSRLLQRIPASYHDSLMLVTTIGMEITLQAIERIEDAYLVVRGRMGGSTDTGRIFFVPFDQINYLGYMRLARQQDISALLGEGPPPPPELKIEAAPLEETAPDVLPEGAEPGAAPEQSRPAAVLPGKAALLERLRSRARKAAGQPPAGS